MKEIIYTVIGIIVFFLLMTFLSFAFGWFGLEYKKTFKIKDQNIEREIFENSQSYVHGKI